MPHISESVDRSFEMFWIRVLYIQINLQRRNLCKFTHFPCYTLDTSLFEIFALISPVSQAADIMCSLCALLNHLWENSMVERALYKHSSPSVTPVDKLFVLKDLRSIPCCWRSQKQCISADKSMIWFLVPPSIMMWWWATHISFSASAPYHYFDDSSSSCRITLETVRKHLIYYLSTPCVSFQYTAAIFFPPDLK